MPEFCAPALGNRANLVTIDARRSPRSASGVLYALGGAGGGLTCYLDDGVPLLRVQPLHRHAHEDPLRRNAARRPGQDRGRDRVTPRPGRPARSTSPSRSTASSYATGRVPISAPLLFTANDCLDIGTCLGGPVSLDYYDRAPFPFNGTIRNVNVRYVS